VGQVSNCPPRLALAPAAKEPSVGLLINDGAAPLDSAELINVSYEWADWGTDAAARGQVTGLAPGGHALLWRDDAMPPSCASTCGCVRTGNREVKLWFELPQALQESEPAARRRPRQTGLASHRLPGRQRARLLTSGPERRTMSYAIAVVAPPIPAGDAQAWDVLDGLIDDEGPAPAVFRTLHDQLTARYPCLSSLPDDQIDDGVWSDGPLWNNFSRQAAVLGISYSRVEEVLPYVIEIATALGLSVFDWPANQIHRADGLKGLTLTVENQRDLGRPTLPQVEAAVDALTPHGGPGYLVLEGAEHNYAQAAGGEGAYTAEWREYSGPRFRHWVAGLPDRPAIKEVSIPTNGFQVAVKENECLSAADVKIILAAFGQGQGRPAQYVWRDVTERFE
jgi:hypothetical protein